MTLKPGAIETFLFEGPSCPGCLYDLNVDNTLSLPTGGDLDFYTFTGLFPGAGSSLDIFEQTSGVDTLIFRYDEGITIIDTDVFSQIDGLFLTTANLRLP